jgi:hypothetical protein
MPAVNKEHPFACTLTELAKDKGRFQNTARNNRLQVTEYVDNKGRQELNLPTGQHRLNPLSCLWHILSRLQVVARHTRDSDQEPDRTLHALTGAATYLFQMSLLSSQYDVHPQSSC